MLARADLQKRAKKISFIKRVGKCSCGCTAAPAASPNPFRHTFIRFESQYTLYPTQPQPLSPSV